MTKEVILTGLRSNDEFHLGNYLGAIMPMVELQKKHADDYQLNMFIPDLHSFTTPVDHDKLYAQSLDNLGVFVAAGLDIEQTNTFIYRQSYIPAHSELTWILDCFTNMGQLSRMSEFKEKGSKQASVGVGLFNYPVLMAADILLYGAKWVPVGEDQRQHVEFTRDLAIRVNAKFGNLFVVPEDNETQAKFVGRKEPVRIRSLRNPEKKMSKSSDDAAGTVLLSDGPKQAAEKIKNATTDSKASINYDWQNQPGITNLLQIEALLSGQDHDQIKSRWEGKSNYGELKQTVATTVSDFLTVLQEQIKKVDPKKVLSKLEADEKSVVIEANATLERVQKAVGLRPKG